MDDSEEKWELVQKLSLLGDYCGDKILSCMVRYGVTNTRDLTVEQLKEFIEEIEGCKVNGTRNR